MSRSQDTGGMTVLREPPEWPDSQQLPSFKAACHQQGRAWLCTEMLVSFLALS